MRTTLAKSTYSQITTKLRGLNKVQSERPTRCPIHVLYGGANLFSHTLTAKLGGLARQAFESYCLKSSDLSALFDISPEIAALVHSRVKQKLETEPIEDLRVDFEDGYGKRSDAEEDQDALKVAQELILGVRRKSLPPFYGIRIKPLDASCSHRSLRTLDLVLTQLAKELRAEFPGEFKITLPKVSDPTQVKLLLRALVELEKRLKLRTKSIKVELLIETPTAVFDSRGNFAVKSLISACQGRCESIHFGTYDFSSSVAIPSTAQRPDHFACDLIRELMQLAVSGTETYAVDSVINRLPIVPFKGEHLSQAQVFTNKEVMLGIWQHTFKEINRSISFGFRRGWDLHPAQLPVRYIAVYNYYLSNLRHEAKRLRNFVDSHGQSTRVGNVFDDAAMALGISNFFKAGLNCGAFSVAELEQVGLDKPSLIQF